MSKTDKASAGRCLLAFSGALFTPKGSASKDLVNLSPLGFYGLCQSDETQPRNDMQDNRGRCFNKLSASVTFSSSLKCKKCPFPSLLTQFNKCLLLAKCETGSLVSRAVLDGDN